MWLNLFKVQDNILTLYESFAPENLKVKESVLWSIKTGVTLAGTYHSDDKYLLLRHNLGILSKLNRLKSSQQ